MSQRNRPNSKKVRQLERALRKGRLPRWLDLSQWLQDQGHAQTAKDALKIILERRVVSESHVVGFATVENDDGSSTEILDRYVKAELRPTITVTQP